MKRPPRESPAFALVRELEYTHRQAIMAQWRYERARDDKGAARAHASFKRFNLRFDTAAAKLRVRVSRLDAIRARE